ncbi:A24 family peptidase [Paenibacillus macerans]|uniref:A24 family peptidase n=1 Tax=Paenibacillus macerans TaxID=44252 RepID=UPI00203E255C|nr:prepilin peptidase [Paenibacillus macerans]MCM3699935.1 prepilin peptidase [Paenibacillus macerans]
MSWEYWGCFLLLAAAFVTDIRSMKIPNWLTLPGLASGFLFHALTGGWNGIGGAFRGAAVGFGLMFILYLLRAVGGGDVKLFAGIGAWTGISFTLSVMMYSILAAGCIGLFILLCRREMLFRLRRVVRGIWGAVIFRSISPVQSTAKEQLQFPFMLAVLPGAILSLCYQ